MQVSESKSYLSNTARLDSNCVDVFKEEEGGYFVSFGFESVSELPRKLRGNRSQCPQGEGVSVCLTVRHNRAEVPSDSL